MSFWDSLGNIADSVGSVVNLANTLSSRNKSGSGSISQTPPPGITQSISGLQGVAGQFSGLSGDLKSAATAAVGSYGTPADADGQGGTLGSGIRGAYQGLRNTLNDEGTRTLLGNATQSALGAYGQLADSVSTAGSPGAVLAAGNRARNEGMLQYEAMQKQNMASRAAAGLNPLAGQSQMDQAFAASAMGGLVNQAREAERAYGDNLRVQAAPHLLNYQNFAANSVGLVDRLISQSYGEEGAAVQAAWAPYYANMGSVMGAYQAMLGGGTAAGNYALSAAGIQQNANLANQTYGQRLKAAIDGVGNAVGDWLPERQGSGANNYTPQQQYGYMSQSPNNNGVVRKQDGSIFERMWDDVKQGWNQFTNDATGFYNSEFGEKAVDTAVSMATGVPVSGIKKGYEYISNSGSKDDDPSRGGSGARYNPTSRSNISSLASAWGR